MKKLLLLMALILCVHTTAFGASHNSITKYQHLKNGASLAAASLEITPYNEIETGASIIITFSNATVFSQDILDGTCTDSRRKGYRPGGYQYANDGIQWDRSDSFFDFMPNVGSSELPYYIRRINDEQIEVRLINLPDNYANGTLEDINGSKKAPYYSIPLVVYADIEGGEGEVGIRVDSNGTSISDMGYEKVNGSASQTTTVKESSAETTTHQTETKSDNTANAEKLSNKVEVQIGAYTISVNGRSVALDSPAYIQGAGSTMLPLRAVSQGVVGSDDCVSWDASAKTAVISYGGNTVSFTAGSDKAVINGKSVTMANGVKAEIVNSRMFVPFRALGEALGADVSWIADTKTAVFN